jgi:predicted enzyme related to lactoylglutathione lyase
MTNQGKSVPNNVAHFSITATDVDRARAFYEAVFGWRFEAWGPPGFYLICSGTDEEPGVQGALQGSGDYASGPGVGGVEITVAVEDVSEIARLVEKAGGRLFMREARIPGVGTLVKFEDTEGNRACAMQYEPAYRSVRYTERRGRLKN